ncbi:hypothetical protein [Escherichia whittamii]|uniref:hypothetical protein n=1 Tax=Escherichia TaxID=561 RepID=UPI00384C90C5
MRDLQTSDIVQVMGMYACDGASRSSDQCGDLDGKKNVAVLPTVSVCIRATKVSTGGYINQGNKFVFASPLVITGSNGVSICIPRHASRQFQALIAGPHQLLLKNKKRSPESRCRSYV